MGKGIKISEKEWQNDPKWVKVRKMKNIPAPESVKKPPIKPQKVITVKPKESPVVTQKGTNSVGRIRKAANITKAAEKTASRVVTTIRASKSYRKKVNTPLYKNTKEPTNINNYPYEKWDVDHPPTPGRFDHLQPRDPRFPASAVEGKAYLPPPRPAPMCNYTNSEGAVQARYRQPANGYIPDYPMSPRKGHLSGRGYLG